MSSLKMTFSLASLVLLMAFFAMPVMAAGVSTSPITGGTLDPTGDPPTRFGVYSRGQDPLTGVADGTPRVVLTTELPNLQEQFRVGTTIVLLAPAATPAPKAKDVVISEIMWGLNSNAADFDARDDEQFIEFYNTTAVSVDMADWILYIVDDPLDIKPAEANVGDPAVKVKNVVSLDLDADEDDDDAVQYVVVDMVSNDAGGRWTNDIGQSGTLPAATPVAGVTVTPVELVSMYRKINYTNVLKADLVKDDVNGPKNRIEQLKAVPDGTVKGSWAASPQEYDLYKKGSPGTQDAAANLAELNPTDVNLKKVIINEIGNAEDDKYDWIELRNTSGADITTKNYELSNVVGDKKDDVSLIKFPEIMIPKDDVLLVVNTDPKRDANHPLAGGVNVITEEGVDEDGDDNADNLEPIGVQSRYYVNDKLVIPDSKVLFLLRSAKDKTGKAEALVDVTGTAAIPDNSNTLATKVWPLVKGAINGKAIKGATTFADDTVYRRNKADQTTNAEDIWVASEDAGGIGYKRVLAGNGTPGYVNGAAKVYDKKTDHADYAKAPVTISEIMYHTGRNLPQWIELYNSSLTDSVKLDGWELVIENDPDDEDLPIRTDRAVTLKFANGRIIPPNDTVLIVTTQARRKSSDEGRTHFPDHRVIDIWDEEGIASKDPLDIDSGTSRQGLVILSQTAFKLILQDAAEVEVDVAGNLGEGWDLPTSADRSGNRHSIIRRYDAADQARPGTDSIGLVWKEAADPDADPDALTDADYGWLVASDYTISGRISGDTYYGSNTDLGTPGYRRGGALPVSLSKFRPERLDSGAVVVRWITESELNNAGFNILRSETRDGEFTKLNTRLIAGQGTISERTVYEYADTSAKPNVVYYYQIQDVSLDGKVQTLRQSRLKGNVTAAGKLTTIWGELKALQ